MRTRERMAAGLAGLVGLIGMGAVALGAVARIADAAGLPDNGGSFTLIAHSTTAASHYAPTFTGNGLLGVRVPPAGEGYTGGTVPAQSELAGF